MEGKRSLSWRRNLFFNGGNSIRRSFGIDGVQIVVMEFQVPCCIEAAKVAQIHRNFCWLCQRTIHNEAGDILIFSLSHRRINSIPVICTAIIPT